MPYRAVRLRKVVPSQGDRYSAGITPTPTVGFLQSGAIRIGLCCCSLTSLSTCGSKATGGKAYNARLGHSWARASVLFVKKIGQWELSSEAKRSTRALSTLPKLSEPWAGGASILLKRHCSSTTCLLLGSFCPTYASPSVSADCSEPTQEGVQSCFETRPPS